MTTTSTQQAHPVRASWRTAAQTVISVVLVLGVVAPLVAAILHDELGEYLPEAWLAWVVAAAAILAAVSAALARIMAIPAVDAWLRHLGLSSTPTAAEPFAFLGGESVQVRASGLAGTVVGGHRTSNGVQYDVRTVEGTFVYQGSDLERIESPPA